MSKQARGNFQVTLKHEAYDEAPGAILARSSGDKIFEGDLVGTSVVNMLAARSEVQGSAGYVAIERVKATLHGREGTFVLQHSGKMNRGKPSLEISVVADSGTDALRAIAGTMTVDIVDTKHFYTFDYALQGDG